MKSFVFIIAARNNNLWIDRCLNSINIQTYPYKRVIYIDDHSDKPIIFPQNNLEITIIKNNKRYGPAYSRWIGLKQVTLDEIVIFLDGDDWLAHKQVLEYLNKFYLNNPEEKWSISNYREFYKNRTKIIPLINKTPIDIDRPTKTHLRSGYSCIWKDMPESWIKFGQYYLTYMTDYNENLWAIKKAGQPYHINSVLMIYNCDSSKTVNELNDFNKNKIKSHLKSKFNFS